MVSHQNCTISDCYHARRRTQITRNYPEIRNFVTVDPSFKYVAFFCACTQICISYLLKESPLLFVLFFALCVGTLFDCAITNSLHEIVHDLAFDSKPLLNKVFGNFVNLSMAWPIIGGYYTTHRYHHSYLGTDLDVKYAPMAEIREYDKNIWTRLKFVFLHPILGGPRWQKNVGKPLADFAYWNTVSIIIFNFAILIFAGWKSLLYLLVSFWINDTIFIQGSKNYVDHWVDEVPHTNSYYGFFNLINFNIGYHREHHDFPNIPGRYLPEVKRRAGEFYSDPSFIYNDVFVNMFKMLIAEPYQGLAKYANKISLKSIDEGKEI